MECNVAMDSFKKTCKHLQTKIKPIHFSPSSKSDLQNIVMMHKRNLLQNLHKKTKKEKIELIQPSRTIKQNIKIKKQTKTKNCQEKLQTLTCKMRRKKGITSYKQERHEHNNNMKHKGACTSQGWKWQCKA